VFRDAQIQRVGFEDARASNEKQRIGAKADHCDVSPPLQRAAAHRLDPRGGGSPSPRRR
jgi:hypothetical protein